MSADNIVVINNGTIVEQGNHDELMKNKGYYYNLCAMQGVTEAVNSEGQGAADTNLSGGFQSQNYFRNGDMERSTHFASPLANNQTPNEETTRTLHNSNTRRRALTRSEPTGRALSREQYTSARDSKTSLNQHLNFENDTQTSSAAKQEENPLTKNQKRRRRKKHFRKQSKQMTGSSSSNDASGSSEGRGTNEGES